MSETEHDGRRSNPARGPAARVGAKRSARPLVETDERYRCAVLEEHVVAPYAPIESELALVRASRSRLTRLRSGLETVAWIALVLVVVALLAWGVYSGWGSPWVR